ncbi:MAG: HAD family phosphatase [Polyangiaceae bacterium]
MAASYFDVDGTLIRTNLVHPTLFTLANMKTPLESVSKLARAAAKAPAMLLAERRDRRLFNEVLFSSYAGVSHDRVRMLSEEIFDKVVRPALYPYAKDLVARCRAEGHDVVIVSGALVGIMEHLASYLGATHVIANHLEFKDGFATGRIQRPVVAGPEKARLVREHARAHGHNLDECFAYSDSYSDVPMLSIVGHPAAVNPDAKLEDLARTYGWPVLSLKTQDKISRRLVASLF